MGYWADAIIDCEETSPERARELAASIIGWLVDARIIEDRQCDGCMRDGPCYLPGPAYQTACKEVPPGFGNSKYESFLEAGLNGMRVVTSPQFLFNSSGAFPDMRCPRCDAEVDLGVFATRARSGRRVGQIRSNALIARRRARFPPGAIPAPGSPRWRSNSSTGQSSPATFSPSFHAGSAAIG